MKKLFALFLAISFTAAPLIACGKAPLPPTLDIESSNGESAPIDPPLLDSAPTEPLPAPTPTPEVPPVQTPTQPTLPPVEEPVVKKAIYIRCTGESVNLRAGAGTDFAVLGRAEKGTMYAVTGKSGGWYKTYYRGKVAYLSASYASVFEIEKTADGVEEVIEEGYKLLGVPYVYGAIRLHDGSGRLLAGFTAQKFDCSSLVQYMYYKGAGKLLGVTTRVQVRQGKFVKRSELRRGDCIYFTNADREHKTGIERVGHVAVYLGDGYILHTASDYARIEKVSAKRWGYYVEARRFL